MKESDTQSLGTSRASRPERHALPMVSILVAARNEEDNIRDLLVSLSGLSYPKVRLEILLGDDASQDDTLSIMQGWAANLPHAHVVAVQQRKPGMVGKANVLAHLCELAQGDVFLFTDADCQVPRNWVYNMIDRLPATGLRGVLTGVTVPTGNSPFANLQAVDWLAAQSVIALLAKVGIPVTAMGNNMAITAEAYQASGGFEATRGTITEDYAIFHRVLAAGYRFGHAWHTGVLATTKPMPDWAAWMQQRKRWFVGALQLPLVTQLPYWFQMVYYPLLLVLGLVAGWEVAGLVWLAKTGTQTLIFIIALARIDQWRLMPWLIIYDFWAWYACCALYVSYRSDKRIVWKGNQYYAPSVMVRE